MANTVAIAILADASKAVRGFKDTETGAEKMQRRLGKASKIAAAGLLAVGVGALALAKGAAEDAAAATRLATTLKNTTGATKGQVSATEDWITAQGKALGVADDDLRPAIAQLATATGDLGKAQKLAALAMDISAGSGKSLESVSSTLAKAQLGNVNSLKKLGVETKNADGSTKSLTKLQDELAKKYKGQAATAAGTLQGKMARLRLTLAEAGETIGAKLIPFLTTLADVATDKVGPAISKTGAFVKDNQKAFTVLAVVVAAFGAALLVANIALGIYNATTKIVTVATKVWAAGQWVLNAALSANPIGLIVLAIVALVAGLVIAYKKSDTFRAIVQGAFAKVKAAASAVASFFTQKIPAAFGKVKSAAGAALGWVKANWPKILAFLTGPIGLAVLVIAKNWGKIKDGARAAKDFVVDRFNKLLGFFRGLPGKMSGAFSGLFDGFKDAFRSAINFVIDKWNDFELKIKLPKIAGGGSIGIDTPNIPRLAKGGIVTGPTLALIGEGGHDEAVIPLDGRALGGNTYRIHITAPVGSNPIDIGRELVSYIDAYETNGGRRRA